MQYVYVLNKHGEPLMPCSPRKARLLLKQKKACVIKRTPFTVKLLHGSAGYKQPVTLGVDAGSKHIGISATTEKHELYREEATPRNDVVDLLSARRAFRRSRRNRKTRYRAPRFNTTPYYLDNIVPTLAKITGYPLTQADDLFDATENLDSFVRVSSCLKACAVNLSKMCNDLRILASGPKAGFGEITLPAMQNGSSIMPGKVNPVIPEVVSQVAFHIIGHDTTITMAAEAGQMELNAFEPVIFYNLFDSIATLTHAVSTLTENCILGITANEERCHELLDASVGITTALCPYIGYKKAASLAKESLATDVPVKKLVLKYHLLKEQELDAILDPYRMTKARGEGVHSKAV